MSEQMLEEFEKWAKSRRMNIQKSRRGSYYHVVATDNAWRAWQASRQALVVDLPRATGDAVYDAQEVHDALDKAGVPYK